RGDGRRAATGQRALRRRPAERLYAGAVFARLVDDRRRRPGAATGGSGAERGADYSVGRSTTAELARTVPVGGSIGGQGLRRAAQGGGGTAPPRGSRSDGQRPARVGAREDLDPDRVDRPRRAALLLGAAAVLAPGQGRDDGRPEQAPYLSPPARLLRR